MTKPKSKVIAIEFQCSDVHKTNEFYESLGVGLNKSGIDLFLTEKGSYTTSSSVLVLVECEDVAAMSESLKESGVAVIEPAALGLGGLTMIIADPDGRHILLSENLEKFKSRISALQVGGFVLD